MSVQIVLPFYMESVVLSGFLSCFIRNIYFWINFIAFYPETSCLFHQECWCLSWFLGHFMQNVYVWPDCCVISYGKIISVQIFSFHPEIWFLSRYTYLEMLYLSGFLYNFNLGLFHLECLCLSGYLCHLIWRFYLHPDCLAISYL